LVPGLCFGVNRNVLIVNGSSTTPEPAITTNITANLSADVTAVGGTVTVSDTIPTTITGYGQVWDVRYFSTLSAGDITKYVGFMAGGGSLFVMGEDVAYAARNASLISLFTAAGGGSLTYTDVPGGMNATQNVVTQVTTPNPVTSFNYNSPGGVMTPGTGAFITVDPVSNRGAAVLWRRNTMTNAANGALAVVFDVNFMIAPDAGNPDQTNLGYEQNFLKNLIGVFINLPDPPINQAIATPTLSQWGLILLGGLLLLMAARALRTASAHR
jgi:hypothetical protein